MNKDFLSSALALAICISGTLAPAWVRAQTAPQPSPPSQICVNGQCVGTGFTVSSAGGTGSSTTLAGTIKWNPGNYMASYSLLTKDSTLASVQAEMDDINGYDNILGYRVFISWGALEPTEGNYNFTLLDAVFNRLKTQYNKPKRIVVVVMPGPFAGTMPSGGSSEVIPAYIQASSAYGVSPVSGSSGWWSANSNGQSTGDYVAALYRPAVMDRMIALVQAMGAHYDADPYFEGLMFQEDAWMVGAWSSAPDYSDAAFIAQLQRLLASATAAFPHTNIVMENTWIKSDSTADQAFEQWMIDNRVEPGAADTVGQSAFANYNYAKNLAWGLQAYMGIQASGSSWTPIDLRPQGHAMMDVEQPDLCGPTFAYMGAAEGFQPLDLLQALNQTYKASHAFWTHLFGSEPAWPNSATVNSVSPWAKWSNLAPVINSNFLTTASYPENYQN